MPSGTGSSHARSWRVYSRCEESMNSRLSTGGGQDDRNVIALAAHPERVAELPAESLAPLLVAVAAQQAALSALQGLLASRLVAREPPASEAQEHLLTADEVARTLGVTRRWVQRRAGRLP